MKKAIVITIVLLLAGIAQAEVAKKKDVFHNISGMSTKPATDGRHRGIVKEVLNVDVYTYIQIEEDGKEVWIATSTLDAQKGDKVETSAGTLMGSFYSKQLNRTFPEIIFATDAKVVDGKTKAAKDAAHASMNTAKPAATTPKKAIEKHKGIVRELKDVDSYTYLLVEEYGRKVWIAAPRTPLKVGDTIEAHGGMQMTNFKSKTLNKTFDEIYFISDLKVVKSGKAATDKPKTDKKPEKKKETGKKPEAKKEQKQEQKKESKDPKETK